MIRLSYIARTPPKPRKRADTRALEAIRKNIHRQLAQEVMADCIEQIERHEAHGQASHHFRLHGETMN